MHITFKEQVNYNYPARACASRGLHDRGWCQYICIYICLWSKKYLNRTLEIDSPFQHSQ